MGEGTARLLRSPVWVTVCAALFVVVGLVAPVLGAPELAVIGAEDSPTLDHLWGLWVTAQGLLEHGPLLRDTADVGFPRGFRSLQYEAVNLLLFVPGFWLGGGGAAGAALGWNLLSVGAPAVAMLGGALLGRELIGDRPEVAVLAVGFGANAWLLGSPYMGHTEYLAAALWPLHLWMLARWVGGSGWRWAVGAGATLGAMAATASYLPVFLALLEPVAALALVARSRAGWRGVARLLPVAALGLALAAGFAGLLLRPWPLGHGAIAGQASLGARPIPGLDTLLPGLLRGWPGTPAIEMNEQPAYPGMMLLGVATLGAVAVRSARVWWALGVGATTLGLGVAARAFGTALLLPAGWLVWLHDGFDLVHWWQRIGVVAPLPLAVAALYGARWLGDRLGRPTAVAAALSALCLLDQATFPRGPVLPAPSTTLRPPDGLVELVDALPPGALLVLPVPLVHLPGKPVSTGPYLAWQATHGRPISTVQTLLGDRTLRWCALTIAAANRQAHNAGRISTGAFGVAPPTPGQVACMRGSAEELRGLGFAGVVLHIDRGQGAALEPLMAAALGVPQARGDVRVWDLSHVAPGESCRPPDAAPPIRPLLAY